MTTISEALRQSAQHLETGNLQAAEMIFRQILAEHPRHAETWHQLGLLAHRVAQYEESARLIQQAILFQPQFPEAYSNLSIVLGRLGRQEEALEACRHAIRLKPNFAAAYNNLGATYEDLKQYAEAAEAYQRATIIDPNFVDAHCNNSGALLYLKRYEEAEAACRQALALDPRRTDAYNNLGNSLYHRKRFAEAIAAYQTSLAIDPNNPVSLSNLGLLLQKEGNTAAAIPLLKQAITVHPQAHDAYLTLGVALKDRGQLEEAVATFHQAIALRPNSFELYCNLGAALKDQGRLADAITALRHSLSLNPQSSETFTNLGLVLREQGEHDAAVDCLQKALQLKSDLPLPLVNLANVLKDQGQTAAAITHLRRALEIEPDHQLALSNLILTSLYCPDVSTEDIQSAIANFQARLVQPLLSTIRPHLNDRTPQRRLRIGYVSPDFRTHPVGLVLLPILKEHLHDPFEIHCYASVMSPDHVTQSCQQHADAWHDVLGWSDEEVTQLIRENQIDIVVDLSLHSAKNRLLVFARQPAPVQVSFAGYPGSTGVQTIAYHLTDPYLEPLAETTNSSSSIPLRVLDSFWLFDTPDFELPVGNLPASTNGYITFGCLNNFCKVNEGVIALWAKVLAAVPNSRLLLLAPKGSVRDRVWQHFEEHGIEKQRVEFCDHQPRQKYFELYQRIDLGLDTFPYNGHTTSLDSCWMGVPVITLVGKTIVGRGGVSILSNLGLTEMIAADDDAFVRTAASWANDLPRLKHLRATLRERMEASPLMDASRFTRNIEAAYRQIWQKYCANERSSS